MIDGYQPDFWHWWILALGLLLPAMKAEKDTAGEPLFMPLQTHWDSYLGLTQAELIVNRLQPGIWDDGLQIETAIIDRPAEVAGEISF